VGSRIKYRTQEFRRSLHGKTTVRAG